MKFDWELFNDILKRVEKLAPGENLDLNDPIEVEHAFLLRDSGMVELYDVSTFDGQAVIITRLTLKGHNYLKYIQNQTVFNKIKALVKNQGGRVAIDVILELAQKYFLKL